MTADSNKEKVDLSALQLGERVDLSALTNMFSTTTASQGEAVTFGEELKQERRQLLNHRFGQHNKL